MLRESIGSMQSRFRLYWGMASRPTRTFFISLLLLNGLLFLPLYLLNWEESILFPFTIPSNREWQSVLYTLAIGRENLDPFRINIELLLFVILLVNFGWMRRPALRHLFIGLYFFLLSYYIYEAITLSIYQSEPVFYNHFFLALDGLSYLFDHLDIANSIYIGVTLAAFALIWVIYRLAMLLYQSTLTIQWGPAAKIVFTIAGLLLLFAVIKEQHALAAPTTVLSSLSYKVEENIDRSLELYRLVSSFDDTELQEIYDYSSYTLQQRPNIYLLFVESYGSVLYKRPDYRIDYSVLLKQLKRALDQGGWYSTSTLSEAPTWGGGSWLSYTSAQFGLRIDNHPYYLTLQDKYQYQRYPHLGSYLQDQGYKTYRLSSLADNLAEDSWERYERMYNVNDWFRFEDLDYTGPLYGWGPATPDQYALNYTRAQIIEREGAEQPFMLFFITQNSHYPFAPVPKLVPDWRTLNQLTDQPETIDDEEREHSVRRQDYFNSIAYDLNMLVQFILQNDDKDALYMLIGDHQPPRVSRRADGFDTPIHIISRNESLIAAFQDHGFTPGLWVNDKIPTMKHEGLYSMVVRSLISSSQIHSTQVNSTQMENANDTLAQSSRLSADQDSEESKSEANSDINGEISLPPYLPNGFVMPDVVAGQ